MVKDAVEIAKKVMKDIGSDCNEDPKRGAFVDCCCPGQVFFIFNDVNCVQIFNGSCESWRPGGPCLGGPSGK